MDMRVGALMSVYRFSNMNKGYLPIRSILVTSRMALGCIEIFAACLSACFSLYANPMQLTILCNVCGELRKGRLE